TGHAWKCFSTPSNLLNRQRNVGPIHSSNLCCLHPDERAVTQHGILTLKELAEIEGSLLVPGRTKIETASNVELTLKDQPIVKVSTKQGYETKITLDHPLWVVDEGWVEAKDLKPGDKVEIQQIPGLFGPVHEPELALVTG